MIYIEAPNHYEGKGRSLFLAGGISNCPDWQSYLCNRLAKTEIVIFNPRRKNFSMTDPGITYEQIKWEHTYLRTATAVSFWFTMETLNPITLYEFGAWSMTNKLLFVGTHPEYTRRQDVIIQTKLVRPEIEIVDSLDLLANQIINWWLKPTC